MNTVKLQSVLGEYAADALKILLTWFLVVMGLTGASFQDLYTQKALITLAMSFAVWASACVSHYVATNDPTPLLPMITATATSGLVGPAISWHSTIDTDLRREVAELKDRLRRIEHQPEPAPEPPTPPAVV